MSAENSENYRGMSRTAATMMVALGVFGLAHKGVFYKHLYPYGFSGHQIVMLRWIGSLPLAFVMWFALETRAERRLPRGYEWIVLATNTVVMASTMWMHTVAFRYLDAGFAGVLIFFYPLFVLLFNYLFWRERPTRIQYAQGALLVVALALLMQSPGPLTPRMLQGVALTVGAGVIYAFYLAKMGRWQQDPRFGIKDVGLNVWSHLPLCAGCAIWMAVHPIEIAPADLSRVSLLVLGMVLFCGSIPFVMMLLGMRVLGAARTAFVTATNPAAAGLLAVWWLGETMNWELSVASVLMVGAMLPLGTIAKCIMQRCGLRKVAVAAK